MTVTDYAALRASIQVGEGLSLELYQDTTGHWSIGYGHDLTDDGITAAVASLLLDQDLDQAIALCQTHLPYFSGLDGPRQRVLAEMCFNIGIETPDGLLGFTRMLSAVQMGRYDMAASEMLRSTWAVQVGVRARRLADLMQQGNKAVTA